jgi:hypothetical protein
MKKPFYADLANQNEDDRIAVIGNAVMQGAKVGFIVDADPGKAERYIEKLKTRFPGIVIVGTSPGPAPATIFVKVERQNTGGN